MSTLLRPAHALFPGSDLGSSTVVVTIAKPPETGIVDWMSHLRDWLNQHGIEPAGFKRTSGASGNQTYEVSFRDRNEADLFAAEFDQKHLR